MPVASMTACGTQRKVLGVVIFLCSREVSGRFWFSLAMIGPGNLGAIISSTPESS